MDRLLLFFVALFCGVNGDGRIVGGRPAREGELRYQVSLRRSYNDNHFCGGSIISSKTILTAAHCIYYSWGGIRPPSTISIFAGQLQLKVNEKSIHRNATKIIPHPNFNASLMFNDLAIIHVNSPFPLDNNIIAAIPLIDKPLSIGTCIVSGWGKISYAHVDQVNQDLLLAEVDIVPFPKCQEMYEAANALLDDKSMLCAGHPNGEKDACQGDSGGPLAYDKMLVGVVSTGKGCGSRHYPGIYVDVYQFLDWINKNVIGDTNTSITTTTEKPVQTIDSMFNSFINMFKNMFTKSSSANIYSISYSLLFILLLINFF